MPSNNCDTVTWSSSIVPKATVEILQSSGGLLDHLLSPSKGRFLPSKRLMIMFPGNPGSVIFYEDFAALLHSHEFDVLVMGFAGHSLVDYNEGRRFSLQDQIDTAHQFVGEVLASRAAQEYAGSIYVSGHSIGGTVALHMLARFPQFKLYFGLCPVVSRIAESPNGRRMFYWGTPLLQWVAAYAGSLFGSMPLSARRYVVQLNGNSVKESIKQELIHSLSSSCLMNVFYMSMDEYRCLLQPDAQLLRSVQEKMVMFYVPFDGWAPPSFTDEIKALCPQLHAFIMSSDDTIPHAWCLKHNQEVFSMAIEPFLDSSG